MSYWDLRGEFRDKILAPLAVGGIGLEVAPYFNPFTDKTRLKVLYADYLSTEEIREKAAGNPDLQNSPVPEVDIVWRPGKPLLDCAPPGTEFDYAVASHVMEHVPNPIGWLNDILDVMKVGGVLAIILPDKRATNDYTRHETTDSELAGWWLERPSLPTPAQVYDFLSNGHQRRDGLPLKFMGNFSAAELRRSYEDPEVVNFMLWSYNEQQYLDVHCSVWTPDRFAAAIRRMVSLGIMNVEVSEPLNQELDFALHLKKLGDPALRPPAREEIPAVAVAPAPVPAPPPPPESIEPVVAEMPLPVGIKGGLRILAEAIVRRAARSLPQSKVG